MGSTDADEINLEAGAISERCTAEYVKASAQELCEKYGLPVFYRDMIGRVCGDQRMAQFWHWYKANAVRSVHGLATGRFFATQLWHSTQLPKKPGNLPPALREKYFSDVRKHANALQLLLKETVFDRTSAGKVSESDLLSPFGEILGDHSPYEDQESEFVTFEVTHDGVLVHGSQFAERRLTKTLDDVIAWTRESDHWDGLVFSTSDPIAQSNSARTPIVYFTCTLFDWFEGRGLEIPFPMLATIANVALDMRIDEQLDEDAVRKQIRRHQSRQARKGAGTA